MRLYRLSAEASGLVTRELARGERRYTVEECERFLDPCETVLELEAFDAAVADIIARTEPFDARIDQLAAPLVHRTLRVSRREAADPGIWRFLAVVHAPDFIRHRWENRSWATTRTRYWQYGTRPDSNALCRLWWIAELTAVGESYELTQRVLARQPLATAAFVRTFSGYRPAIEAYVDVLEGASGDEIEQVVRRFSGLLSTVVLEGLSRGEIAAALRRIRAEAGR